MEEIIVFVLILLTMLTTFCLYKMFDKRGLYFALVIMNLISFVLSFKISYVLKMNVNVGIVPIVATFNVLYLFVIKYGTKEIKNILKISLYSNITTAILLIIMNYFIPAITETISINMQGTFEYNYKILIVFPVIMLISEYLNIKLFSLINNLQENKTISIMLTYIITGLIYTIVFYLISYINIMEVKYNLYLGVSTYILGLVISISNITFINFLNKKKVIKC